MAYSSNPLLEACSFQALPSEFPSEAFVALADFEINCRESTLSCWLSETQTSTHLSCCVETALKSVSSQNRTEGSACKLPFFISYALHKDNREMTSGFQSLFMRIE